MNKVDEVALAVMKSLVAAGAKVVHKNEVRFARSHALKAQLNPGNVLGEYDPLDSDHTWYDQAMPGARYSYIGLDLNTEHFKVAEPQPKEKFVVIVKRTRYQQDVYGPYTKFKTAEGDAQAWGGVVEPMKTPEQGAQHA